MHDLPHKIGACSMHIMAQHDACGPLKHLGADSGSIARKRIAPQVNGYGLDPGMQNDKVHVHSFDVLLLFGFG